MSEHRSGHENQVLPFDQEAEGVEDRVAVEAAPLEDGRHHQTFLQNVHEDVGCETSGTCPTAAPLFQQVAVSEPVATFTCSADDEGTVPSSANCSSGPTKSCPVSPAHQAVPSQSLGSAVGSIVSRGTVATSRWISFSLTGGQSLGLDDGRSVRGTGPPLVPRLDLAPLIPGSVPQPSDTTDLPVTSRWVSFALSSQRGPPPQPGGSGTWRASGSDSSTTSRSASAALDGLCDLPDSLAAAFESGTSASSSARHALLPHHLLSSHLRLANDSANSGSALTSLRPSRQHSVTMELVTYAKSMSSHLKHAALGDDLLVQDRWLPLDALMSARQSHTISFHRESGSVVPLGGPLPPPSTGAQGAAGVPRDGSLDRQESAPRGFRTLLWYYFQMFLYSLVVACPIFVVVICLSRIPWHVDNADPKGQPAFFPNSTSILWTLFLQCTLSMILYAVILYMSMMRTWRVPLSLVCLSLGLVAWALLAVALAWHFGLSVWYYYLHIVLIVTTFFPVVWLVSWLTLDEGATVKERLEEVKFMALLEMLVTTATLAYIIFIIPYYYELRHAWQQLLWMVIVHPLYFELTTAAVMRKALYRQVLLGRDKVTDFLPLVHMMVHIVGLGIVLQGSIEPLHIMALSLFCSSMGKLLWRSTVLWRDLFFQKLVRWDLSFTYDAETRLEMCKLISLAVMSELILDNAGILTAPFMLWCMYKEPLFMSIVPNTFFNNSGTYPVAALVTMISIMFGFMWLGDIAFFCLNYYWGQRLPIIYTWRRIKDSKWSYLGFLAYAIATMGVMFNFTMMLILPRAAFCRSDNYCDCPLPVYQEVCTGTFISTLVDYLL